MSNGEHQWLTAVLRWGEGAVALLATASAAAVGWMFRRYITDRERLTVLEAKVEKSDLRLGALSEALESAIEMQDELHDRQENMRNDLTEIKNDVKWIRRTLNNGMKDT